MPPVSDPAASGNLCPILHSPSSLTHEVLAGVFSTPTLIPEVISLSIITNVGLQVSLVASVVLCLATLVLGGRPAMVTAAARSAVLAIGLVVYQYGAGYTLPAVILANMIQILFGLCGMACLMRLIPPTMMTGFVNTFGILIFFTQVSYFWSRQPLIASLFVLAPLIVLWAPHFVKAAPVPLTAVVALTFYTVTTGQQLSTVGNESSISGGLLGFTTLTVPLNPAVLQIIWSCALSIALVGLMESLLTAKPVDNLTHTPLNKSRGSAGLGTANVLTDCYGGIAGCATIGQAIVNVEMGRARSRLSTVIVGLVLLLLVTALSQVVVQVPIVVLVGVMATVATETFSWHSIRSSELVRNPWPETLAMLVTVAVTAGISNLAIGVLTRTVAVALIPCRLHTKVQAISKTASPNRGK